MSFYVALVLVGSILASPALKGTFGRGLNGTLDVGTVLVQVTATPALDTSHVTSVVTSSSIGPNHHHSGCHNGTAKIISTLATTSVTRLVKRAIVETQTVILPTVTNTITATVSSAIVTPTSVLVVDATASQAPHNLSVVPAVAISSPETDDSNFTTSAVSSTSEKSTPSKTKTATTENPQLADLRKDFLTSLKDVVRKVVNFSVGVMLTPFLIGAHRVQVATTTTPSSLESNQIDTN